MATSAPLQPLARATRREARLLTPNTPAAKHWLHEHVIADETQFRGEAVVVESKYVEGINAGILDAGFTIEYRVPTQH